MRIAIIEDQAILRDSLARVIDQQGDMEVVAQASNAEDACDLVGKYAVDLVIMDVCTDNGSSGIVASRIIKETYPNVRIVVMTGMPEVTFVQQAQCAGVDSFVYKNLATDELLSIIRSTMEGYSTYPHKKDFIGEIPLTDEEVVILRMVCETKTRREIADELYLSEGTVKRRITNILAKTGYDSILKLAVHAVSSGYIVPNMNEGGSENR